MTIKFKEEMLERIERNLISKKRMKPMTKHTCGIGVKLGENGVQKNDAIVCDVEELNRMIEELQMLKDAIEEETGLDLR